MFPLEREYLGVKPICEVKASDGELCLNRVKPEETLVEARSGSDVQIDLSLRIAEAPELAMRDEPNVKLRCRSVRSSDTTKGVSSSRQPDALKMDGAQAYHLYFTHSRDYRLWMQILVVVANIQMRTLKTEVEKGSVGTAVGNGLVDPNWYLNGNPEIGLTSARVCTSDEPHASVGSGALVTVLENPQEGRFIPSRTDNRSSGLWKFMAGLSELLGLLFPRGYGGLEGLGYSALFMESAISTQS
ncbi:hypothetical protein FF38_03790 [Lucilia cuprina]|uniref:Uncharacterized protein n=1 Tax=Lucilia cuprina TaxID=7375 RepID=A0A0L0C195_LUCCU|nr:hypothetical protein FF38_03790 [Lucilia cuprina]